MERKFFCRIQIGKRCKGNLPRYVSSAELVGDDIVIHTSPEPVPVSLELANAACDVVQVCSNISKFYEFSRTQVDYLQEHSSDQEVSE